MGQRGKVMLNVCIDVDLTLIDKDGQLLPGAKEGIAKLREAGCSLTLWSLAGAEYAKSVAAKHGMEDLFDGIAGKPDVAIDDDLESLRPQLKFEMRPGCNWTKMIAKVVRLLESYDGRPNDSRAVLALVEKCKAGFFELRERDQDSTGHCKLLAQEEWNYQPIPFFGNPFGAEILTMALNPSWTEFESGRNWPTELSTQALTSRLLGYFDATDRSAHAWFAPFNKATLYLERPYLRKDAAHVDPFPHPTKWLCDMDGQTRLKFGEALIETVPDHLKAILRLCRCVKLLMIRDYPLIGVVEGINSTFDFIAHFCPAIGIHIRDNGEAPPVLRLCPGDGLSEVVYGRRIELLNFLQEAEPLNFL
jgi:hypothetical protein